MPVRPIVQRVAPAQAPRPALLLVLKQTEAASICIASLTSSTDGRLELMRLRNHSVHRLLEEHVLVRDVSTPKLYSLDPNLPAAEARTLLSNLGFDRAPIDERPIRRTIDASDLDDRNCLVGELGRPIRIDEVVSDATSLARVLPLLQERDHFYVLNHAGIQGLVTRADLQNPIVSMAILGIIVSLEVALTHLIAEHEPNTWKGLLSEGAVKETERIYRDSIRANIELTEIECLSLPGSFDCVRNSESIRDALGLSSKKVAKSLKREVVGLRDPLAHGRPIATSAEGIAQALATVGRIENLAEAAWSALGDQTAASDID